MKNRLIQITNYNLQIANNFQLDKMKMSQTEA